MNLEDAIQSARHGGASVMVKCPAHEDGQASLHVSPGTDQPVTLRCFAGCEPDAILAEAHLSWEDVCTEKVVPIRPLPIEYSYVDEAGAELFQAVRLTRPDGGKDFRQRHRGDQGQWIWNLNGVRRVLYRLPQVIQAVARGQVIWLVEGEKDVATVERLGQVATTNPMGAGKWQPEYTESLRGSVVHIIADADRVGRDHARTVATILREADCTVRTFEANRDGCKDVTNHIEAGGTLDDLMETTIDRVTMESSSPTGMDVIDYLAMGFEDDQFVIPNTLAREERVLVTGFEGHGKSTLLRQMAVMCAAGIHPWTLMEMTPCRVLVVDAENGLRQMQGSWSQLVGRAAHHRRPIARGMLNIEAVYLSQPDLTSLDGRAWLHERVAAYRPDVIFLGPIQNLTGRDVKDDEVVRRLKRTVDEARMISQSAVVMEHHAPHKAQGDKERSVRPYGSSLFMKWPDFGYGMKPTDEEGTYDWHRTRYPRERTRQWPERIRQGRPNSVEWPWMDAGPDLRASQTLRSV